MKLQDIILLILFIFSLIVLGWFLFGNSPTFEEAILVFILTIVFGISIKLTMIDSNLKSLNNKFNHLSKDFKEHLNNKSIHK